MLAGSGLGRRHTVLAKQFVDPGTHPVEVLGAGVCEYLVRGAGESRPERIAVIGLTETLGDFGIEAVEHGLEVGSVAHAASVARADVVIA